MGRSRSRACHPVLRPGMADEGGKAGQPFMQFGLYLSTIWPRQNIRIEFFVSDLRRSRPGRRGSLGPTRGGGGGGGFQVWPRTGRRSLGPPTRRPPRPSGQTPGRSPPGERMSEYSQRVNWSNVSATGKWARRLAGVTRRLESSNRGPRRGRPSKHLDANGTNSLINYIQPFRARQ